MHLAILSDIHEDYENLLRIVAKAEARGFDKLICLGDISGYSLPYYKYGESRNAPACLALLREKCDIIIVGNHDLHAAGIDPELPDILKGQDTWQHELDLDPGYSEEDISFLATLPFYEILTTPTGNILFSHYVYPNLTGFVVGLHSREEEFQAHFAFMQEHNCSLSFTGHAHPRGFYKVHPRGFKHYHNRGIKITTFPALIGIPPATRNQHHRSFCIFDTISRKLQVFK
ncbi:MAG: metallophosphoesterase family protein [Bacteroidota bacterium]|nr:metallophosphoesterase family protein [Bacteroidota bacterium]